MTLNRTTIAAGPTSFRSKGQPTTVRVASNTAFGSPRFEGEILVYWIEGSGPLKIMQLYCAIEIEGTLEWKTVKTGTGAVDRYTKEPLSQYVS